MNRSQILSLCLTLTFTLPLLLANGIASPSAAGSHSAPSSKHRHHDTIFDNEGNVGAESVSPLASPLLTLLARPLTLMEAEDDSSSDAHSTDSVDADIGVESDDLSKVDVTDGYSSAAWSALYERHHQKHGRKHEHKSDTDSGSDSDSDRDSESNGYGPETVKNWSGYITVHPRRHLFYWFFESRSDPRNDPLVIWLTGGPGCSSLIAMFMENGPYIIDRHNLSLSLNPHSWNNDANILWIDQPAGTGFSVKHSSDVGVFSEREVSLDLYEFIVSFLIRHPEYAHLPLFLTGESYAGHYLPALAARIADANSNTNNRSNPPLNLRGVAIGNGLVDAKSQYASYATFARQHGIVSHEQAHVMESTRPGCTHLIAQCAQHTVDGWHACLRAHVMCAYAEVVPIAISDVNVYDARLTCGHQPLCYQMHHVHRFLNQRHVQRALGVRHAHGVKWHSCNMRLNQQMALGGDWMLDFSPDVSKVLESGVRVLVYSGEWDVICNHIGNLAWVEAMHWSGRKKFNRAKERRWVVDGQEAGQVRTSGKLTFLRVKDAGHMVPMDQPRRALDMINRFFRNQPFHHKHHHNHHDTQRPHHAQSHSHRPSYSP